MSSFTSTASSVADTAESFQAEKKRLLALARRHETPCGAGVMVWHTWGVPGDPPVLLLHGGAGSWTHWLRNVEAMAANGRYVLVPDMPGFGESAKPAGASDASSIPEPLEQGLRQLIGERACAVVAFSFGGIVIAHFVRSFPQRVDRLVIVGTPVLGPRNKLELQAWRQAENDAARLQAHRHNLGVLMLHGPEAHSAFALALHVENVERDRLFRRHQRVAAGSDVLSGLQPSAFPIDVIFGEKDSLYCGHFEDLREALKALPTFRTLSIVPSAGHWVQFESAAAFNALVSAVI